MSAARNRGSRGRRRCTRRKCLHQSSRYGVDRSIEAADRAEQRVKRSEVYERFLQAANGYGVQVHDLLERLTQCDLEGKQPADCPQEGGEYHAVRAEFQRSLNDIYTYGSVAALKAAKVLAGTLPPAMIGLDDDFTVSDVNDRAFDAAWSAFAEIERREVRVGP